MLEFSRLTEELSASQKGICFMQLVGYLVMVMFLLASKYIVIFMTL
jgi:hypothetical protein